MEKGLPVSGYRPQSEENIALVNEAKELEERTLRFLDRLAASGRADGRWFSIGRTDIEKGFMAVNRSVFQPSRVVLTEKAETEEMGWVIEEKASSPSAPYYFTGSFEKWESDSLEAMRFARHTDALKMAETVLASGLGEARVCMHTWS